MTSFFWGSRVGVDSGGNADGKATLGFVGVTMVSPPGSTIKSNMVPEGGGTRVDIGYGRICSVLRGKMSNVNNTLFYMRSKLK